MSRFEDLSNELVDLYSMRYQLKRTIESVTESLEKRKFELTPPDGWEGSNQTKRDATRDAVFADDKEVVNLTGVLKKKQSELSETELAIQKVEALRRGCEYSLLELYVEQRYGQHFTPSSVMADDIEVKF